MKKLILFLFLILSGKLIFAQDIDDIKDEYGKDLLKAKTMVDKYLNNPKHANEAEGWYYKGVIYNAISKKDSIKSACTDCKWEAFEAFKKYKELDPKDILMQLEQNGSLFDLYNGFFDQAAKAYNNKDYSGAFANFRNALQVEDYVRSKNLDYNGFKFPTLDTSLVLNTALAARAANDDSNAVVYYKKLTDADLSAPPYQEAYEYEANYYDKKKDDADLSAILDKGKKFYPNDEYWTSLMLNQVEASSGSKTDMLKKYGDLASQNPSNYALNYNYAVELYNYSFANDDKTLNTDTYKDMVPGQVKKVIAVKETPEADLLLARYYYNRGFDYIDKASAIRGVKADDMKMKKSFNDSSLTLMDQAIPYAQGAQKMYESSSSLSGMDKTNYKQSLSILTSVYQVKKDNAKAEEYSNKLKSVQ